jgi:hypothetical protein
MSAYLLSVLFSTGLVDKSRDATFGLIIIPLLVDLLDTAINPADGATEDGDKDGDAIWTVRERTPEVLARLVVDNDYLQECAWNSGAISRLSNILRSVYKPIQTASRNIRWSPVSGKSHAQSRLADSSDTFSVLAHHTAVRESSLRAIAAMIATSEECRKTLVDEGIVPHIVESLKPFPSKPSATPVEAMDAESSGNDSGNGSVQTEYGVNSNGVLIAACTAILHLSRSVSILRTTLTDSRAASPVLKLLHHPDIGVQTAATSVICNLVIDPSPMREVYPLYGTMATVR